MGLLYFTLLYFTLLYFAFYILLEIVQNHVSDVLHVTSLSKNYMVQKKLCITAVLLCDTHSVFTMQNAA